MTEQPLVLASEARHLPCSNCGVVMRLDAGVVTRLTDQAAIALTTIDRLHRKARNV